MQNIENLQLKLNMQKPEINKPIFVVGVGHSGNGFLATALSKSPEILKWEENNKTWMQDNIFKKDDRRTAKELNQSIKKTIKNSFLRYIETSNKSRICDKTPANCLRIPFVLGVFPDAKIIHIVRDGRAVLCSTQREYTRRPYSLKSELEVKLKGVPFWKYYVFLPRLPGVLKRKLRMPINYWGGRPPGWQKWTRKFSQNVVIAKQWVETIKIATDDGRKVAPKNYLEIRYEDFINSPRKTIIEIAEFAELKNIEPIIEFCEANAVPNRVNKWRQSLDRSVLDEIQEIMEPTMSQLGYEW